MRKITVWEDSRTGQMFKTKRKYVNHLKRIAKANIKKRDRKRIRDGYLATVAGIYDCSSIQEICDFIMDNQEAIQIASVMTQYISGAHGVREALDDGKKVIFPKLKFIGIKAKYGSPSNSHAAPKGKKTNWCGKDDGPTSYPGFAGRIAIQSDSDHIVIVGGGSKIKGTNTRRDKRVYDGAIDSSYLRWLGVNTGTGGGGSNAGYDVKVFEDDFPNIKKSFQMRSTFNAMKSEDANDLRRKLSEFGYGKAGTPIAETYGNCFGHEF